MKIPIAKVPLTFSRLLLTAALVALAASAAPLARADHDQGQGSRDDDERYTGGSARVRGIDGAVKLERYEDDTVDEASVNSPIFPGDAAVTLSGGRAEVQLPSGSIIRLDENSRLTFTSLPRVGEGGDEATLLQLSEGGAQVEVRGGTPRKGDFQIDTPSASVYLLATGRYRIDIEGRRGRTRVSTYRGVAEVAGDEGSVMLRSAQRTFVGEGGEPDGPRSFNTASADSFDAWILDRNDDYRRARSERDADVDEEQIPDPVRPYRSELSYYGRWVSIPQYGRSWIPAGVAPGWRPYSNGHWAYGPGGAFWVSYDPWGWAPYHYGRWSFYSGYGWIWIPGSVFSGAWVSWYYGPTYVGWCPLDFWDYPCHTGYGYGYGGIDYHCWNFVTYHNVYVPHVTKVYVNPTVVRLEVVKGGGVIVRRPIKVAPGELRRAAASPGLVIGKARSLGNDAIIDPAKNRAEKRAFKEKEKDLLHQAPRGIGEGARPRVDRHPEGSQRESAKPGRDPRRSLGPEPVAPAASPRAGQAEEDSHRSYVGRKPLIERKGNGPDPQSSEDRARPRAHRSQESDSSRESLKPDRGSNAEGRDRSPADQNLRDFLRETDRRRGRSERSEAPRDEPGARGAGGPPPSPRTDASKDRQRAEAPRPPEVGPRNADPRSDRRPGDARSPEKRPSEKERSAAGAQSKGGSGEHKQEKHKK